MADAQHTQFAGSIPAFCDRHPGPVAMHEFARLERIAGGTRT